VPKPKAKLELTRCPKRERTSIKSDTAPKVTDT